MVLVLVQIPILTEETAERIPNETLVRYRGMVSRQRQSGGKQHLLLGLSRLGRAAAPLHPPLCAPSTWQQHYCTPVMLSSTPRRA